MHGAYAYSYSGRGGWGGLFYGDYGVHGSAWNAGGYGVFGYNQATQAHGILALGPHGSYGYSYPGRGAWGGLFYGDYGLHGYAHQAGGYGIYGHNGATGIYGLIGYSSYSFYGNSDSYTAGMWGSPWGWWWWSDARLKENVRPIESPLENLLALKPVHYHWKKDSDQYRTGQTQGLGFIAQDMEKVYPEIVVEREWPKAPGLEDREESLNQKIGKVKSIRHDDLIAVAVAAIQEIWVKFKSFLSTQAKRDLAQDREVEALRSRVSDQEARIRALDERFEALRKLVCQGKDSSAVECR